MGLKFSLDRVVLDRAGIDDVADLAGVGAAVLAYAQRVETMAAGLTHSRRFRAGLQVVGPVHTGHGWEAAVGTTYWGAHLVEFGSINNAPQRALTNAARQAGLDFVDTPA